MCRGVIDIEAKSQQRQDAQSMLGRRGGGVPDFCGFQRLFARFLSPCPLLYQLPEPGESQTMWERGGTQCADEKVAGWMKGGAETCAAV